MTPQLQEETCSSTRLGQAEHLLGLDGEKNKLVTATTFPYIEGEERGHLEAVCVS